VSQEYVNLPVPVDRVQEVYELLGRPKGSVVLAAPATPATQSEAVEPDLDKALLKRAYRESPDTMRKVFDHLADKADHDVPMEDLARAVGYHPHQMAGAFGAFGRRWKNRYHKGEDVKWPFGAWWDFDRNTMVYKMSAEAAAVIKGK
jgi:hypothetical protein